MSNKFGPGDLIRLNQYGLFITPDYDNAVGIVISESYSIIAPLEIECSDATFYTVYDILLNGELYKMVPEEFMEKYKKYEEDSK